MPEAIVLTREYDGTCTVRIGRSLILSSLSRAAADGFVATYRRLAAPATSDPAGASPATGGRAGQVAHRSLSASGRVTRVKREQG